MHPSDTHQSMYGRDDDDEETCAEKCSSCCEKAWKCNHDNAWYKPCGKGINEVIKRNRLYKLNFKRFTRVLHDN